MASNFTVGIVRGAVPGSAGDDSPSWRVVGPLSTVLLGLGAAWLAPSPDSARVAFIAAATVAGVFVLPALKRFPSHVWVPSVGALLLLVSRRSFLHGEAMWRDAVAHLPIVGLVLGVAYLSLSLDETGFFRWCAVRALKLSRGSGRRLLVIVFFGVSALTLFTSNDVVVLAVTPIVLQAARTAKLPNAGPYLVALFVAANTASMALYGGNPTNIVVASAVELDPMDYALRMIGPAVIATAAAFGTIWLCFTRRRSGFRIPARFDVPNDDWSMLWNHRMSRKVAACAMCPVSLIAIGSPGVSDQLGCDPATVAAIVVVAFAGALLVSDVIGDRRRRERLSQSRTLRRLGRLPVDVVPFLIGFCLLIRGVETVGLTRVAQSVIVAAFEHGAVVGSVLTGLLGIVVVNLSSNIPASMFFGKLWGESGLEGARSLEYQLESLHPAAPDIVVEGALFASNFGANLTVVGALAGVMWFRILRQSGQGDAGRPRVPTVAEFSLYGAVIVLPVTVITCAAIAARHLGPL